jgi:multicomponent Na+:H+ antiporter subunit A
LGYAMFEDVNLLTFGMMFLPFVAALLAPSLFRLFGASVVWFLALLPALAFAHFATFLPAVSQGAVITAGFEWVPALGLRFSWLIDGLSLTFALLITGIGTLIVLYAGGYLKGHVQQARFLSFLFMFMGAMLGLVLSDGFLMLFVFWELTAITSFLLIGFDHSREASRRAALQALVVTGGGGLALLAGLLLVWNITGTTSLSTLLASGDLMRQSPLYVAALLLLLGGAFTKSAQFPFHFWLPNAMEAPTPVSAFLHSATMVKAGVYLLMRLNPVMGATPEWEFILPLFGSITLIVGATLAIRQTDLKLMLAYTTVASLGLLVMLTGFGTDYAIKAAVLYLIAHSLFKGALFMVAGIIDHEAGTRDVTKLGGLGKLMPITFGAALIAALSMGGLPPLFGFMAKEVVYEALAQPSVGAIVLTLAAIIGNALMFAIAFAVALKPFVGPQAKTPKHAHEGPALLWLGPVVLAATGLMGGFLSVLAHQYFSSPAATAVAGTVQVIDISVIPHLNIAFGLSVLTVVLGVGFYLKLEFLRDAMAKLLNVIGFGPDRAFDCFVQLLVRLSFSVTRAVQPGRLEFYVTATFALIALALLIPLFAYGQLPNMPVWPKDMLFHEAIFIIIAVIGLIGVLTATSRLTAIIALGIQGFAVAVLFLLFGAPDLSFTQFMIETLSVVVLTLVMTRLRLSLADHRSYGQRLLDGTIGIACGLGFGMLLMRVTQGTFDTHLTEFFNSYSRIIAHGQNVVNVIIVDYRGTDTLGEIAVVMITGLAILALVRLRSGEVVKPPPGDHTAKEVRR